MILILGASGGIGNAIDRYLCQQRPMMAIMCMGGRKACDITVEEDVAGLFARSLVQAGDSLHIVLATGYCHNAMLHKSDLAEVKRHFDVNVIGPMLVMKHARRLLKEHGGSVTILSSVVARRPKIGTASYAASKAAITGLVGAASKEFAPFARVNAIELGYYDMGMISQVPAALLGNIIEEIALNRLGAGEEAGMAVQHCIENTYLNGAVVSVTGGLL